MLGLGVAVSCKATLATTNGDGVAETRTYTGTREIRHVIDVAAARPRDEDYHGVFDVEASRTSKRSGSSVFETETRFFAVQSGGYRRDAAMREVIVRDEHVSGPTMT
jgi:hypothetical protein